jgi:hypothetical protein
MKNIYLIPTDKPSRLFYYNNHLGLARNFVKKNDGVNPQHIYITSEEAPKHLDWYFCFENKKVKKCETGYYNKGSKKIILTTGQDLIEDGVQAIDDEFLEWFVKNPSCEEVEVESFVNGNVERIYEIIIPKEEPKQETVEQAAKRYYEENIDSSNIEREYNEWEIQDLMIGFANEWQQEQDKNKYSEDEVLEHLNHLIMMPSSKLDKFTNDEEMVTMKWFEQFKKK